MPAPHSYILETIDRAINVDINIGENIKVSTNLKKTSQELKQDTKLISLLRGAVSSTADDDDWSNLADVGGHITNQASFDSRNYGYTKLYSLFEAIDLFEIQRKGTVVYVRNKQKTARDLIR